MKKVSKKKQQPLISVVVPVYNVEEYLDRCINSIVNQTYNNLEIILVDDGSIDNSSRMCDEWKKKDNRIKVFHKKNGGVSSARNEGIFKSNGEFIFFCDSDDFIELNMIELLYDNMNIKSVNLSICNYYVNSNLRNDNFKSSYINKTDMYKDILRSNYFEGYLWNKLFDLSIIKKNNLLFDINIFICEDLKFVCQYLEYIDFAYYDDRSLYHYCINEYSAMNNKKFSVKFFSSLDVYLFLIKLYSKNYSDYIYLIKEKFIKTFSELKFRIFIDTNSEKKSIKKYKNLCIKYYNDIKSNYGLKERIQLFFSYRFPIFYNYLKSYLKK